MEKLFSYGTLQYPQVQKETFGRILEGKHDMLPGYVESTVEITDPIVLERSGQRIHPILHFTGNRSDMVSGMIFEISYDELMQSDLYEADDYQRIEAEFHSGTMAWVYVSAERP